MWDFNKLPDRLRSKFLQEYLRGNLHYVYQVVKAHKVFSGACDACMKSQLADWMDYQQEQGIFKEII